MTTVAYTGLLGLALPTQGDLSGQWGTEVNNYITTYLDSAVAGVQTISGTQTAVTLSVTNGSTLVSAGAGATGSSQYMIINCTGTPASLLTITAPGASKVYVVINGTAQSVKLVGTGPTAGVTMVTGEKAVCAWNGTDFVKVATSAAGTVTNVAMTVPTLLSVSGSPITSTGTLALTYSGTALPAANGGTGVANNAAMTVTGSGNYAYTRTLTGTTNVTFPTTGTLSTLAGSETLTNKTLTTPIIASISNTGTLTLPTSTDTLVGKATTDTLTNKTLTSPTLTTPVLGTPSSGTLSSCTVDGTDAVGFRNIPINSQSTAYTTVLADSGKVIFHPSTDASTRTFKIDSNANVAYPLGTAITFINMTSNVVTIAIETDTMYLSSAGTTGSRSLAIYGSATAIKMTATTWLISGSGLT